MTAAIIFGEADYAKYVGPDALCAMCGCRESLHKERCEGGDDPLGLDGPDARCYCEGYVSEEEMTE